MNLDTRLIALREVRKAATPRQPSDYGRDPSGMPASEPLLWEQNTVCREVWSATMSSTQETNRAVHCATRPRTTELPCASTRHRCPGPDEAIMRVMIAGAGNVGRALALDLLGNDHQVLLIDHHQDTIKPTSVPRAQWLLADACELSSLEEAETDTYDVAVAATGDDKTNLVFSLLARTEFGVPRIVARVNHPKNEWLFTREWGVDVAVSTPRLMSALVEEAVSVGDLVRLLTFHEGGANLVEMTLPADSPALGRPVSSLTWPGDAVLVAIVRDGDGHPPHDDDVLISGDELIFVTGQHFEHQLAAQLLPDPPTPHGRFHADQEASP